MVCFKDTTYTTKYLDKNDSKTKTCSSINVFVIIFHSGNLFEDYFNVLPENGMEKIFRFEKNYWNNFWYNTHEKKTSVDLSNYSNSSCVTALFQPILIFRQFCKTYFHPVSCLQCTEPNNEMEKFGFYFYLLHQFSFGGFNQLCVYFT